MRLLSVCLLLSSCAAKWGGWEKFADAPSDALMVLRARSSHELWAADALGSVFVHDGSSWRDLNSPVHQSTDVDLVLAGPDTTFFFGGVPVYQVEGASFTPLPFMPPAAQTWFRRGWAAGPKDLWVEVDSLDSPVVMRWDGATLTRTDAPCVPSWGAAADDAWGFDVNGSLWHWDGSTWTDFHTHGIRAVGGLKSDQVWAVGDHEQLLRWDGAQWSTLASKPGCASYHDCSAFNGVVALSENDLWVVGEDGPGFGGSAYASIRHWDGSSLATVLQYGEQETDSMSKQLGPLYDPVAFDDAVFARDFDHVYRLAR
jgi:hypothetical protein